MGAARKAKKKVDYEALGSSFMRVPRMDAGTARHLLDLGYRELFELRGLSAESLWEDINRVKKGAPEDTLYRLRMLLYFVEEENPDMQLMYPECWKFRD